MLKTRPQHAKNLSFVQISDFESPGGLEEAVKDVDAIIHTASVSRRGTAYSAKIAPFAAQTNSNGQAFHLRHDQQ